MCRTVLEKFPAGGPRGSWPAEEFARARRDEGTPAEVVMDLDSDVFLVVVPQQATESAPQSLPLPLPQPQPRPRPQS